MKILSLEEQELKDIGAFHTAKEIWQQPQVWGKIYEIISLHSEEIRNFLKQAIKEADQIILTGAGTSAFIGMNLENEYQRTTDIPARAVPTTDLITTPLTYFSGKKNTLLISFARSGDSPESCAAVDLAEQYSGKAFHLIITCNNKGKLYNYPNVKNQLTILLPEETNDKSLAMTSSYTGMLLAALLISRIQNLQAEKNKVALIRTYAQKIFDVYLDKLKEIAALDFNRVVVLSSGALTGTARESTLKIQELSDGHVMGMSESFLGFRHGPKAVINNKTLVFYLFSNDPYVYQYEYDLLLSMKKGRKPAFQLGISEAGDQIKKTKNLIDLHLFCTSDRPRCEEEYLAVCDVLPAQIIGLFKSITLGLSPDHPSNSGAITRVVEGVNIYPFN